MIGERRSFENLFNTRLNRVERLERRIAERRMSAALDTDWDQLHHRSRAIARQLTQQQDATRQIVAARQLRFDLLQAGDLPGLRALRLATAAPMVAWLQNPLARAAARSFARQLTVDQREAISGLAHLEEQLSRARGQSD